MSMWKGMFSPALRKHHGGTLEDHIILNSGDEADLDGGWSLDGNTLTVSFHIETDRLHDENYEARWELSDDEVEQLEDGEISVEDLIGQQLKMDPADRRWKAPKK